jgi:hypothetical protein
MKTADAKISSNMNAIRRGVMLEAWRLVRASPTKTFGAVLKEAWASQKLTAETIAKMMRLAARNGGVLNFSPDLTRSPIRRALGADPYASRKARSAAYMTSRLGR